MRDSSDDGWSPQRIVAGEQRERNPRRERFVMPFGRHGIVCWDDWLRGGGYGCKKLPGSQRRCLFGQCRPDTERTGGFVGCAALRLSGVRLHLCRGETDVVAVMVVRRDGGRQQHEYRRYQG